MTPRERWNAVFRHELPDRVPTDIWATGEVFSRLFRDLNVADEGALCRKLHIDRPIHVGGRYTGPQKGNLWGLEYRPIEYGEGQGLYNEIASHPLAHMTTVEEIHAYDWPSPDWFDYSNVPAQLEANPERPVVGGGYEPFLLYCQLRGMEQAMMDLALNPEIVDATLDHIFHFHYTCNERLFEAAASCQTKGIGITYTYVAEDLGTQSSLLMSEANVDRFLKPKMKKMIDLAHEHGIFAFHHSDGAVRPLLPGMVAIGIDLLNPIQWRCDGMDRAELKASFGGKLVFHGAVDNQKTLPFGSVKDVRNEVIENIGILGAGGGYICAPCHNIQPNTPTENIVALYETVHDEGRY